MNGFQGLVEWSNSSPTSSNPLYLHLINHQSIYSEYPIHNYLPRAEDTHTFPSFISCTPLGLPKPQDNRGDPRLAANHSELSVHSFPCASSAQVPFFGHFIDNSHQSQVPNAHIGMGGGRPLITCINYRCHTSWYLQLLLHSAPGPLSNMKRGQKGVKGRGSR